METVHERNDNLDTKTSLAYGVGGLGEGIGYNFFFAYFLFFLTNIIGISPAVAGFISLVAIVWDGVSDPLIGYLSDNSTNPKGRRRPFIIRGAVLFGASIILLFMNLNISYNLKILYFIAVNILYWLGLTLTVIPHTSLGSELTSDFNKRTTIRAYQTFFMNIGAALALSATPVVVGILTEKFSNESKAWTTTAIAFGCIVFFVYFVSWLFTSGKEIVEEKVSTAHNKKFFTEYKNTLANKSLRYVLSIDFLVNLMLGISVSIRVFLYTYNFGYGEGKISTFLSVYSIGIILGVILVGIVANKIGKKNSMILGIISYIAGFVILLLFPSTDLIVLLGLILEAYGNCTFWTLLYSFAYDTTIIEEFKYGEGKEGIVVSLIGLFMKAGNAVGMWLSGIGLSIIGFNAELATQSSTTLTGLKLMYGLINPIVLAIGLLIFARYPLTENKYNILKNAVDLKSESKPYNKEEIKGLI